MDENPSAPFGRCEGCGENLPAPATCPVCISRDIYYSTDGPGDLDALLDAIPLPVPITPSNRAIVRQAAVDALKALGEQRVDERANRMMNRWVQEKIARAVRDSGPSIEPNTA